MSFTHVESLRNVLADAVDTDINTGAGTAVLEIQTSGAVVLATINLDNPAFGAASAGVITLAGVPLSDTNADSTGTAERWLIKDRDGAAVLTGGANSVTLAAGGGDIELSSLGITAGDTVTITSLTYTASV